MEEYATDPQDDLYPDDTAPIFPEPVPGVPTLDDLNASPHPEIEPPPGVEDGVPIPPPGPAPERPRELRRPHVVLEVTRVSTTPAARHVEALMALATFYEEHPEAYVPGGEHFTSAQALLERILNLGGEWEHEVYQDEVVLRLRGMPDGFGPHLHCPCEVLAKQWVEDIGVPEAM